MVDVTVRFVGTYNGHSVRANGSVDLSFKGDYSELVNSVQLLQMLNNDVKIVVKLSEDMKPMRIGTFRLKNFGVDHDGESKIVFNSTNDFVEIDNLNKLISAERFKVQCKTTIEEEEDKEESEE